MQPKVLDRGMTCVFVGYAVDHEGDCYLMWNPATMRVHTTRDVIWLNRFYYRQNTQGDEAVDMLRIVASDKVEDVDDAVVGELDAGAQNTTAAPLHVTFEDEQEPGRARSSIRRSTRIRYPKDNYEVGTGGMEPYVTKDDDNEAPDQEEDENDETEMAAWLSEVEIDLTPAEEKFHEEMRNLNEIHELGLVGAGIGGGFAHTSELKVVKYNEAMAGPDKKEWEKAVEEEHNKYFKWLTILL